MSHLHIPDGVLPLWLIAAGWLITIAALAICSRRVSGEALARKLPLVGVVAALMIVGMSAEIVPIAYHLNLTVLAGIVLGPALGFVATFIVAIVLALFGHGGVTVIGLNALVFGAEAVLGYYTFHAFRKLLAQRLSLGMLSGLAVVVSLVCSTALMLGIVWLGSLDAQGSGALGAIGGEIGFRDPFSEGIVRFEPLGRADEQAGDTNMRAFAGLVVLLGAIGWAIEATVTGLIVGYVHRLRPDLIDRPPEYAGGQI